MDSKSNGKSSFLLLVPEKAKGCTWLEPIENVDDKEDLRFGVSRVHNFPKQATFAMSRDYPKDVALADCCINTNRLVVVSERLKAALEAIPGALFENEVLPVQIKNHKGRLEKAPYFIIHQLDHPPCLDEAQTQGTRMAINPKKFQIMKSMVIDESKVDARKKLFRPQQYPNFALIRREVAEALRPGKFTGVGFHEIAKFSFLTGKPG